ncbi:MAG: hypothetical protein ACKVY0_22865 [Prosthecobacter sp.]|uniref:hypothetical protein n=1 Tax=Prosthecobacter sp. TaxID=1965333 RepID=UPI003900992B
MNPRLPAPYRPATFEEEWDNPAMAQFKREEAEDREAFGHSEEARAWLEHLRSGAMKWSGTVKPAPRLPVYDKAPVQLYSHAAHT